MAARFLKLLPTLILLGCASYTPQTIKINDEVQYNKDWLECQEGAKSYQPEFSIAGLLTDTVTGATNNLSLVPVSPFVPLYGAGGGATGSLSKSLDVMSMTRNNVARNCINEETSWDHSAVVANPN